MITNTYDIDMPDSVIAFGYAVDACWFSPSNKPVEDPMTDFPPEANCPEPWKIDVTVTPVGQGLHNQGGFALLSLGVYDWQGKSTLLSPEIECPELFDDSITSDWKADGAGFTTFEATISNTKLAEIGQYKCLVSVEDTENAPAPDWLDLTAYQIVPLDVAEFVNELPVAQAKADPNPQTVCVDITFSDDGSYDPDFGPITKWEWDWDIDGVYDDEGNPILHVFTEAGTFQVQCRVTDDEDSTSELATPLEITVGNLLPVAEAAVESNDVSVGQTVTFDATGSHDTDCGDTEIVLYEWDFDGSGDFEYSTPDALADHIFDVGGTFQVNLRVTDDEGGTDTLDTPITMEVAVGWARTWGAEYTDYGNDVAVDGYGNSYVTGFFSGTVDFDPGVGEDIHSSVSNYADVFLSKFDPYGTFLWAVTWGGPEEDHGQSVDVDISGIVSVGGYFYGTADFDPGPGEQNFSSNGYSDTFLSIFDTEGNFVWAGSWGGEDFDYVHCVALDGSGNTFVSGEFYGTADFDPGASVDNHTAVGSSDSFLSRFDPIGNFQWALTWGSWSLSEIGFGCDIDGPGNVYVGGLWGGNCDFDPGPGVDNHSSSDSSYDAFLSKFDSSGNYLWVKTWGGDNYDEARGLAVGVSGDICVTGQFNNTVDFDPGLGVDNHTATSDDIYVSKFDSSGNFLWAQTWGNFYYDSGRSVVMDGSGNVFAAGYFQGTVDFDPGAGVDNRTSGEYSNDAFLSKFDASGNFLWARTWGASGSEYDVSNSTALDSSGNVYVTGYFGDGFDFDPGIKSDYHTSNGSSDVFITKLKSDGYW